MDKKVKDLVRSIEDLKEELKAKTDELDSIRKSCNHVFPKEWQSRVGKDYRWMSPAVDSTCRRNKPEVYEEFYKECEICGKEKVKPR